MENVNKHCHKRKYQVLMFVPLILIFDNMELVYKGDQYSRSESSSVFSLFAILFYFLLFLIAHHGIAATRVPECLPLGHAGVWIHDWGCHSCDDFPSQVSLWASHPKIQWTIKDYLCKLQG